MQQDNEDMPRRRGPRPLGPYEDKRRTLSTRITERTRQNLEAAAAESGRSLSQEIELRLEASFERQQMISEAVTAAFECGKRAGAEQMNPAVIERATIDAFFATW